MRRLNRLQLVFLGLSTTVTLYSENSLADFSLDEHIEKAEISRVLNAFVGSLRQNDREVFVLRYFYFESVRDIADRFGASENKIKSQLFRLRKKLAENLKKECIFYEN